MLVPKLIEAIRQGGEEGKEAALVLGLLIEREKVYHPIPEDEASLPSDGGIRPILGSEFVDRRLSKIEVKEGVDGLLRYINETVIPPPRAVWALTKSYSPRTLPHLINLLERFVGDADKEDLVYQALVGIMNFPTDDDSLAAIRLADRCGHGRVKEAAVKYLQQNLRKIKTTRKGIKKTPDKTLSVEGQITMLQRRPKHSHVVVNDRYQGIRVLNPWRGTEVLRVGFTDGYDSSIVNNGWCFRSDGNAVLVLHEESRTASLLELTTDRPSHDLPSPPLPKILDLRYIWATADEMNRSGSLAATPLLSSIYSGRMGGLHL
jgi:hypothetical protein